ncbi:dihydroorotate dehydrogenase (quinone), mitochondrial [Tribolium castaneum]|uniref:Dihydroorotate dehydrogenase (quinone), mitochondrial n=1 Tax=Tribolium castaneum TaxID=7070 RepID=D6X3Z9_TRICA|nr:PREDICTED: dihydroorotate dehydrogenase (quinone), mitochondrial [Tribolium castaneum]EEZ97344.2 Dihydroorotate dehydrogenase (quinone), mitochondrial-like Protein [Tribolium castaneum]|eukprot:XP_970031.1 PREDICTED: dihydroorotate dehydrogenase (quinone), mitochondrial [Tribolium castaneum]
MRNLSLKRKLRSLYIVTASGLGAYVAISLYKNNEKFYRNVVMPLVHLLEPEQAHRLGVIVSKYRLVPSTNYKDPESLKITLFNKVFPNPIGIAAGFDKHAEAVMGLKDIGFGFIEIGSVTPQPQPGNNKPRVFRLSEDLAVINRYGFNSDGHETVLHRLINLRQTKKCDTILGVNLGKNKTSDDAINDYVIGIKKLGPVADYLVINVSSPNTPGLRTMQDKNVLKNLLKSAKEARDSLPEGARPPLLLKLAPDLSYSELKDIANVVRQKDTKIDGLIICNTTVERPQFLHNDRKGETGGLSGKPLREASTKLIAEMYKLTRGEIPIIGVGGVFTGRDAYEKIKAGASVVQLYTSLVYEGPPVVAKIKRELVELLADDGFKNVSEAVGCSVK